MAEGFTVKEMLKHIMHKQDLHEDKLDGIHKEQSETKIQLTAVKGQLKVMNGQVNRNKEDIKSIKSDIGKFVAKITAVIGTVVSAVVAGIFHFIKS